MQQLICFCLRIGKLFCELDEAYYLCRGRFELGLRTGFLEFNLCLYGDDPYLLGFR